VVCQDCGRVRRGSTRSTGRLRAWPGELLVKASGLLAVVTAGDSRVADPERVSPTPAARDDVLLFIDHSTGRAGRA
jgi:hypothetical protein